MDGEWMTQHMHVVVINIGKGVPNKLWVFRNCTLHVTCIEHCRGEYVVVVYKFVQLDYEQTVWGERGIVIRGLAFDTHDI